MHNSGGARQAWMWVCSWELTSKSQMWGLLLAFWGFSTLIATAAAPICNSKWGAPFPIPSITWSVLFFFFQHLSHLYFFFWELFVQIPSPVFEWAILSICFLSSLYILDINPLSVYTWQRVSPSLWASSSLNMAVQKHFSFMKSPLSTIGLLLDQIESYWDSPFRAPVSHRVLPVSSFVVSVFQVSRPGLWPTWS